MVMLPGQKMLGGVLLVVTLTVNWQDVLRFAPSVTVYCKVVTPSGKVLPLLSPVASVWAVEAPLQWSVPTGGV